jgi:hypothetical protein
MKTELKNTNWFLAVVAAAGLAFSTAATAMAHGGGGGGGGGSGHMGSSSFARSSSSGMSRSMSSFKANNFSTKNLGASPLHSTKLNTTKPTNLNTLKNTSNLTANNKLSNLNSSLLKNSTLKGQGTNNTIIKPVNTKFPGSASSISKVGVNKVSLLNPTKINTPASGFKAGPLLGGNVPHKGCFPYCGGFYPWFGLYGLGLWPYGYGSYGGLGGYCGSNYYGGYGSYYGGGTTYVTPATLVSSVTTPATSLASTVPTPVTGVDLQLVDVRLLDNGDAAKQIGPRYRVTFRNAGRSPVEHDFDVALVAADDANLTANLPTIESRISSVPTSDVSTVDLRLPATAFAMGGDSHSEFAKLFVFVDSHGEVNDINRDNNATGVDRTAVQPAS